MFLDRAIPDSLAHYRFLDLEPDPRLLQALKTVFCKKTFILDLLPLESDYARTEDQAGQQTIQRLLTEVYTSLPTPVIRVPVLRPDERADFIVSSL